MAPGSHRPRAGAAKPVDSTTSDKLPRKNDRERRTAAAEPSRTADPAVAELQQRCLDIFRHAFQPDAEDIGLIQEVKGHLYRRDFAAAFGRDEYLRAYASRWSPSRALAYMEVFADLQGHLLPQLRSTAQNQRAGDGGDDEESSPSSSSSSSSETVSPLRVVSLGGGAGAEIVAIAGWMHRLQARGDEDASMPVHLHVLDIANWTHVVGKLDEAISTPPPLSKYASSARKDANRPLLQPSNLRIHFHQLDVLASDRRAVEALVKEADLVTVMFTLNELYSTSMPNTQRLLLSLKTSMPPGSLLLVVDSPGSYSTVSINGADRKYPMHWLLDHVFVRASPDGVDPEWEKVVEEESRWFRLSSTLTYPIELENMRYQIHILQKRKLSTDAHAPNAAATQT